MPEDHGEHIYQTRRAQFQELLAKHGIQKSVIITSTFRSGSSFISSLLRENGLHDPAKERFNKAWKIKAVPPKEDFVEHLDRVLSTAHDGIFTTKLMWPHRNNLARALGYGREDAAAFAAIFPNAKWVSIRRADKFAQAISFWKAKATGRWHIYKDGEEPALEYDFDAIRKAFVELVDHDMLWQDFYACTGLDHHDIVYEEFMSDVPGNLGRLLDFLAKYVDHDGPLKTTTNLKKQSDDRSKSFLARYKADLYG